MTYKRTHHVGPAPPGAGEGFRLLYEIARISAI